MILIAILFLLFPAVLPSSPSGSSVRHTLYELDRTLDKYDIISAAKESRMDTLRKSISSVSDNEECYYVYDELFDHYLKWDPDSAYAYANIKMDLATEMSDKFLINDASMDLARRYVISGMYHEALSVMQKVDIGVAEHFGQIADVNNIMYDIYHWLTLVTTDSRIRSQYKVREAQYLKLRTESLEEETTEFYISKATAFINEGEYQPAQEVLARRLGVEGLPNGDYALLNYWMARLCQSKGDEEQAICYYAESAKYDFISPVKEYQSLIRIAQYCYKQGDIGRAYKYIMRSHIDATQCDSKLRINQIAGIMPEIIDAYERQERRRNSQLLWAVIGLSFALSLLAVALFHLRKSYQRIREANQIKDTYIGEFLSMFAEHVDSLEKYRSNVRAVAKLKDWDALQKTLRSDKYIDEQWDYLMEKFDKTFLGLFPDFVQKLNALLRQDKNIGQNLKPGTLSNELRIFALIRLGVVESSRIAKFLRLSRPTVYNYRVKLRDAAMGKRVDFEHKLMRLGN